MMFESHNLHTDGKPILVCALAIALGALTAGPAYAQEVDFAAEQAAGERMSDCIARIAETADTTAPGADTFEHAATLLPPCQEEIAAAQAIVRANELARLPHYPASATEEGRAASLRTLEENVAGIPLMAQVSIYRRIRERMGLGW